jgi:hypothetical protein
MPTTFITLGWRQQLWASHLYATSSFSHITPNGLEVIYPGIILKGHMASSEEIVISRGDGSRVIEGGQAWGYECSLAVLGTALNAGSVAVLLMEPEILTDEASSLQYLGRRASQIPGAVVVVRERRAEHMVVQYFAVALVSLEGPVPDSIELASAEQLSDSQKWLVQ